MTATIIAAPIIVAAVWAAVLLYLYRTREDQSPLFAGPPEIHHEEYAPPRLLMAPPAPVSPPPARAKDPEQTDWTLLADLAPWLAGERLHAQAQAGLAVTGGGA